MPKTSHNKIISINELWQFFNRSANLFCITGADGYLKQVNPYVMELLGFTEEEMLSAPYINFIHEEDRENSAKQSAKVRKEIPAVQFRNRIRTISGDFKWISWSATYIRSEDNVYLIGQDHSDIHLVEEKLKEEKINKQRNILEASLLAQEKEREEIGRELHDNINQMLATVLLYQQMALEESEHREDMIRKSGEIVRQTIQEIRSLSKNLVGPDLKQAGLIDCIKDLIEPIQRGAHLDISLNRSGEIEKLAPKVKLTIFRVIQEQLNNITRHANAKKVYIHLQKKEKLLSLSITDDGKGFDTNQKKAGIGLNNMRSRIEIHNGVLDITSSEGKGCTLKAMIPYVV